MTETIEIDDITTSTELAKLLGVGQSALSNWKVRHENFPAPFKIVGKISLYRKSEVLRWYAKHIDDGRIEAMRALVAELDQLDK